MGRALRPGLPARHSGFFGNLLALLGRQLLGPRLGRLSTPQAAKGNCSGVLGRGVVTGSTCDDPCSGLVEVFGLLA